MDKAAKLSFSAKKAVNTRKARDRFWTKYGIDTYDVVRLLAQGKSTQDIGEMLWMSDSRIAAYRANLTRGTYGQYLPGCNF